MRGLRGALVDATSVVVDGLRLLARHWPTLLTIFLFGQAVRAAALWGAMQATKINGFLGFLMVPIAPLAVVAALILALRVVAPSLRWATFRGEADTTQPAPVAEGEEPDALAEVAARRDRRTPSIIEDRLALLSATLIPFFAVYAAQKYLREDTRQFLNETTADEFLNSTDFWLGGGKLNVDRVLLPDGWLFWSAVAIAFGLRWLIDRFELPKRHVGWGWLAAYAEVAWVALFAKSVANKIGEWTTWLQDRQAAVSTKQAYENATGMLGPVGSLLDKVVGFLSAAIGQADAILIVPMAWLAVGAVVYGRSLAESRAEEPSERAQKWSARAAKVPAPIRRLGSEVFAGPIDRFKGLAGAVSTFARAGLAPMLLFCLVFALATQVETGLTWLAVRAIGPQEPDLMPIISPYVSLATRGAYTVVMVSLLAAAIDRIMRPRQEEPAEAAATDAPAPAVA